MPSDTESMIWFMVEYADRATAMIEVQPDELGSGAYAARKVALERQRAGRIPEGIIVNVVRVSQ